MRHHSHRERDWLGIAAATAAGLTAGLLVGLVGGELLGAVNTDKVRDAMGRRRRARQAADAGEALEHAVRTALAEHPTSRELGLEVRALGGDVVELTGVVADPESRDLGSRVARGAAAHALIVNRVVVADGDVPPRPAASSAG